MNFIKKKLLYWQLTQLSIIDKILLTFDKQSINSFLASLRCTSPYQPKRVRMKSIKTYARFFEICITIIMPIAALSFVLRWLLASSKLAYQFYQSHTGLFCYLYLAPKSLRGVPPISIFFSAIVDSISYILLFWGGFLLIKLLRSYQRGELFSAYTLMLFKKISRIVFIWSLYAPIEQTLLTLITTLHNPVGQRELSFALSSNDVLHIFIAGFFLIMTSLMHEGYQLKHEHDLTV